MTGRKKEDMSNNSKINTVRNAGSTVALLALIMCFSKVFGFARDIILADIYGATSIVDIYITTLSIPEVLMDILAQTVTLGYIPIAVGMIVDDGNSVNRFTNSVLKLLLSIGILFTLFLFVCPKVAIQLLAPGFSGELENTAVLFLRVIAFTVVFRTVANLINAYLNSCKCFVPGACFGIILDICVILSIYVSKFSGWIFWLPIGALLGTVFQMAFVIPFSRKRGYSLDLTAKIFTPETRKLLEMIVPAAMATGVLQITALVNKALASNIVEGGITMLNYSNKISYFAENILVAAVATVLYPTLSELVATKKMIEFAGELRIAINKLIALLIPAACGLACLSYEIIDILYGHGAFTDSAVLRTSVLMTLSVIGICGIGVQSLLTRALFSMKKVKVSIIVSISLLVAFVGLSIAFSKLWGLEGIAIATGVSYIVGGLAYYIVINSICGNIGVRDNVLVLLKTLFASAVMSAAILAVKPYISALPQTITLILLIGIGVIVYFAVAQLIRIKEVSISAIKNLLLRK